MKLTRRLLSILLGLCLLVPLTSLIVMATGSAAAQTGSEKTMQLYYDEPADLTPTNGRYTEDWDGWHSSLPLGNGFVGANVFGGTESERIQITEKSFFASSTSYINSRYCGGLENFAETYLNFGHPFEDVSSYKRTLTLDDGVGRISYDYNGVTYTREIFTSYPDQVIAIHLTASEGGALSFELAPEIPYLRDEQDIAESPYYKAGMTKTGTVVADAENATVTLAGTAEYFQLNYEALYRVDSDGTLSADNSGEFGKLIVSGASEATIYIACGTNYELKPETFTSSKLDKLDPTVFPHDALVGILDKIKDESYEAVLATHIADYSALYGAVDLDLGGTMPSITTDEMLYQYNRGNFTNNYIYELYYQIGRYFEIATSRDGTLPSNLVGGWCIYQFAPWTGGNWYNINQQMNYWGVFAANLTESFKAYLQFNEARMEQAKANADAYVLACNPDNYTEPGTNGWLVGTGNNPYSVGSTSPGGHSGVGTVGMTTIDYWNYYLFTLDEEALYESIFTVLQESARFYTKFAVLDENGLYLCTPSASPEQKHNDKVYTTVGCAFDQQMMYENNFNYIQAVEIVRAYEEKNGITNSIIDETLLATVNEQIDHYDPVIVGLSGQIKEYREEGLYGEIGETAHRHISQLMGLANGTQINSNTPAWLDAARTTLILRGSLTGGSTGWGDAQRMFGFARCGDGDSAMIMMKRMASTHLYNNMWNNHGGVFQIDGNFGVMAAISEMLVQSHEGYINLLPAISEEFGSGTVSGILARGNFTVDLAWENGAPTTLTVHSGSGAELSVYYPEYATISVTDSKGNAVSYTVEDGIIKLSTVAGESYTITGFTPKAKAKMAKKLTATNNNNTVTLTWEASESENATYNVYRAYESSPTYTYLGTTKNLSFTDTKDDRQATYCIKAYNDDTVESIGAVTTVIGKPEAPQNAVANVLDNGKLQLTWDAVDECQSYRVYCAGELVLESELNVAILDQNKSYAVSSVYYGVESDTVIPSVVTGDFVNKASLYESYQVLYDMIEEFKFYDSTISVKDTFAEARAVLCDRNATVEDVATAEQAIKDAKKIALYSLRNLTTTATYTVTPGPYSSTYQQAYLCDGSLSTRFAAERYDSNQSVIVAEFNLGGVYSISAIDLYEFADSGVARSETTKIEFFVKGAWVEVLAPTDTNPLGSGSANVFHANIKTNASLEASKVRVTLSRLTNGFSKNLSIWELEIWGNSFNINGNIGTPEFNTEKPTSTNFTVAENFQAGAAVYTDRVGATNFMGAAHVGAALKGLKQIRLPIADSSRTSNADLQNFLKNDNVYFTFKADCDGTVYVVFTTPLVNFTEDKGWRQLANGASLSVPKGESLTTLDPAYSDPSLPYYFTRLQSNLNTGVTSSAVAFTYCYALDFKKGDTVSIPTPAVANGLTNENLGVFVSCSPTAPYISAIEINGNYFRADENDIIDMRVDQDATSVTLSPIVISDEWSVSFAPSRTVTLTGDHTIVTVTVSDGSTSRTYEVRITRTKTSLIEGLVPTIGGNLTSAHVNTGYPLEKLTDGLESESSRLALYDTATAVGPLVLIYDLGKFYSADTFYIASWADSKAPRVGKVTIEGYTKNGWETLTSFDLAEIGITVTNQKVTATVSIDTPATINAIRFTFESNPNAKLGSNGLPKGLSIYELTVMGAGETVSDPVIDTVTVNGTDAIFIDGCFYATVSATPAELTVLAKSSDASARITYSPSNIVNFDGRTQTITITATNVFGDSRSYTLVIQTENEGRNVLLGTTPEQISGGSTHANYPATKMTDGYDSTNDSRVAFSSLGDVEFEFPLDGKYDITSMTINVWADSYVSRTGTVIIRGYINGEWVELATDDLSVNPTVIASTNVCKTIYFDAKGVEALRVYFTHNPSNNAKGQSIWEVQAFGSKQQSSNATEDFRILTNVTLHSNFDVNAYVPAIEGVTAITFAGIEYDLTQLTPVEIEGKLYYKLTVSVDAKDGYKAHLLSVTLSLNGKNATGRWNISLVSYLAKLVASNTDEVEKTLVKDILAYVRAAIIYFNADLTEGDADYESYTEAIETLNTLLSRYAYVEAVPESLKDAPTVSVSGTGVARAAFSLDSSVSFVLMLEEGYELSDFTFRVGGEWASVTEQDGCVYVTVNAYRIKDALTWTVKDKDDESVTHSGTFSLATYYASETVKQNAPLVRLVERLAAFSESADAYKDSRTNN